MKNIFKVKAKTMAYIPYPEGIGVLRHSYKIFIVTCTTNILAIAAYLFYAAILEPDIQSAFARSFAEQIIIKSLGIWTFLLLAGLTISWLISKIISGPLLHLSSFTENLCKKDVAVSETISTGSGDEIRQLTTAFVEMGRRLKDSYETSEADHKTLRKRVAEKEEKINLNKSIRQNEVIENVRITVLFVDDQKIIGELVRRMLKSQDDIDFYYYQNAHEAMQKLEELSPTIILQDLEMPDTDGLQMIQYFRNTPKTEHTPLVLLSAEENAAIKAKAFALGANDYIVKMPDKKELIARIRYHSKSYITRLQRDMAFEKVNEINKELREQIIRRRQIEAALLVSKEKAEKEREAAKAANQKITDSIQYAQVIQDSLLPNPENIKSFFPDSFFIWMPRDIVSGDFIFTDFCGESFVLAVIDCTGHGVPGAFMTLIASFGLRKIIREEGDCQPASILKKLNVIIKKSLGQDTDDSLSDDGLDAAICLIEPEHGTLTFAGAKTSLIYIYNEELTAIKGDRHSVGYKQSRRSDIDFNFTSHTLIIKRGMQFYMATDGFEDQLGIDRESRSDFRRFGSKRFKNLLRQISPLSFEKQQERLLEVFHSYKGEMDRQDDVTVVGFGI